jgi:hypothetical protein
MALDSLSWADGVLHLELPTGSGWHCREKVGDLAAANRGDQQRHLSGLGWRVVEETLTVQAISCFSAAAARIDRFPASRRYGRFDRVRFSSGQGTCRVSTVSEAARDEFFAPMPQ